MGSSRGNRGPEAPEKVNSLDICAGTTYASVMKPKQPTPTVAAVDPDANRPVINSFTVVKRDGKYHALAIQSRGTKILKEKVLDSDDSRAVILDVADKFSREWYLHGADPFFEREGR